MYNNLITYEIFNEFNVNCLALTIRKDYRSTIFSNTVNTFKRVSFKVLINIGILNFLRILL